MKKLTDESKQKILEILESDESGFIFMGKMKEGETMIFHQMGLSELCCYSHYLVAKITTVLQEMQNAEKTP